MPRSVFSLQSYLRRGRHQQRPAGEEGEADTRRKRPSCEGRLVALSAARNGIPAREALPMGP